MLLAQISDTHVVSAGRFLFGRIDTAGHLAAAVRHLNGLRPRPDFVVVSGDLVDRGAPEEYANFRRIISALEIPFSLMPGNHDDRAPLRAAFADHGYWPADGTFLHYAIEHLPLRLICLDTLVPGESGGMMCSERLAWLAARLDEAPGRPTVIAMHHPPFATGLAGMDAAGCANGAALGALVARHPQVERIVCGHVHRSMSIRWHGTLVTTVPSTAHQVALDLAESAPVSWVTEPPACHLHLWQPGSGLVTHLSQIGDYGRAVPF
jgi:3',5'-cyclic AMP phosphodiesterase CpdA